MEANLRNIIENIKFDSPVGETITGSLTLGGRFFYFNAEIQTETRDENETITTLVKGSLNLYYMEARVKPVTSESIEEKKALIEDAVESQLIEETYTV